MNAVLCMIPLFLIRFGLLGLVDRAALSRCAHFAPMEGRERTAYFFYQASNVLMLLYAPFLRVRTERPAFDLGLAVYLPGVGVTAAATVAFARPGRDGLNDGGVYRFSRNPMYAGYFLYFLGCAVLTRSWVFLLLLAVFQVSAHWIIRAEERWCLGRFGDAYADYMKKVRRYF